MRSIFDLFWSFLIVGSFSFGGAYSLLPLIEKEIVGKHHWLSPAEFTRVLGMVEIVPGAISIKFATYTGYKIGGIAGAIAANLGNMFTPVTLIIIVSAFYLHFEKNLYIMKAFKGLKFVVIGMIIAVMFKYIVNQYSVPKELILIASGIVLVLLFKLHPALIAGVGIVLSILLL